MAQVLVSLLSVGAIVGAVDAVRGTCVVVPCESCLLPPRCEDSSKGTYHLILLIASFAPKSRCFPKVSSQLPSRTHHTELHVQTIKIQAIAKARAASPPPLKHDGVTSRRSGAISQRHAHAPLTGLHQLRVAHSRDTISVLGPSREARDCVRVCEAVPNIYAGPSTRRWRVRGSPASFMTRGY
jgi:hypothetical protein